MVEYFVNDASSEDLLHYRVFIVMIAFRTFTIGVHM